MCVNPRLIEGIVIMMWEKVASDLFKVLAMVLDNKFKNSGSGECKYEYVHEVSIHVR